MLRKKTVAATLAVLLMSSGADAGTVTGTFPSNSAAWSSATNGTGIGVPSKGMWTTGDYISQTFSGTGLTPATGLTYSFPVTDDLSTGNNETLRIVIDGITVDTQVIHGCGFCGTLDTEADSVTFAPIGAGTTYTLGIQLSNTITGVGGAISFPGVGSFMLLSPLPVPEPTSLLLLGTALLGMAGATRFRRVT